MKQISSLLIAIASLTSLSGAEPSATQAAVAAIVGSLPADWRVAERNENARWIYSDSEVVCTRLVLVGPARTGYRYTGRENEVIFESLSQQEAIEVWIGSEISISDAWRKRNFKLGHSVPTRLFDRTVVIFGMQTLFWSDRTYEKESPEGTLRAEAIPFKRTWRSWERDLSRALDTSNGKEANKPAEPMPLNAARNASGVIVFFPLPAGMAHG